MEGRLAPCALSVRLGPRWLFVLGAAPARPLRVLGGHQLPVARNGGPHPPPPHLGNGARSPPGHRAEDGQNPAPDPGRLAVVGVPAWGSEWSHARDAALGGLGLRGRPGAGSGGRSVHRISKVATAGAGILATVIAGPLPDCATVSTTTRGSP